MSDSSWPHGPQPTRLLHPWDFPGKNTGVGCHCLGPTNCLMHPFFKNSFRKSQGKIIPTLKSPLPITGALLHRREMVIWKLRKCACKFALHAQGRERLGGSETRSLGPGRGPIPPGSQPQEPLSGSRNPVYPQKILQAPAPEEPADTLGDHYPLESAMMLSQDWSAITNCRGKAPRSPDGEKLTAI